MGTAPRNAIGGELRIVTDYSKQWCIPPPMHSKRATTDWLQGRSGSREAQHSVRSALESTPPRTGVLKLHLPADIRFPMLR
jgi:hypothetical protein